jgi:hypothetical protein
VASSYPRVFTLNAHNHLRRILHFKSVVPQDPHPNLLLSIAMASSSYSHAGSPDSRTFHLIPCQLCGNRLITDISKERTSPGTRYYKCRCHFFQISILMLDSPPRVTPGKCHISFCCLGYRLGSATVQVLQWRYADLRQWRRTRRCVTTCICVEVTTHQHRITEIHH